MSSLDSIKLFCDVAQQRSISKAAELNGVTQPAASQRMMALENDLGVQLLDRSHRPLQLTESGEDYYHGCRKLIAMHEKLKRRIAGPGAPLRGEVAIAAIYSVGIGLLNEVQRSFRDLHPQVTVGIEYLQPDVVYERVFREQCDFGILSYPQRWPNLTAINLRGEPMSVVCRAEHDLAGAGELGPVDLDGREIVGFDGDLPISHGIRAYLRAHKAHPRVVSTFDNIDTIKSFVAQTDAAAILPTRTVRREVERGTLAAIRLTPTLVRPVALVYPKGREPRPVVRSFIDHLVEHQPPVPGVEAMLATAAGTEAAAVR